MPGLKFIPKDFSVVWLFSMVSKALQLVVTVLLVRALSVDDYASYTVFFTTSSTILGVAGQSISLAYVRYNTERLSGEEDYRDSLIVFSHVLNLACLLLLLAGSYPLAKVMNVGFGLMLAAIVYGFLLGAIQLNAAFFQSREMYAKSGFVDNAKQLILLAMLALAIGLGAASLGTVVGAYCASGLVCALISVAFIVRAGSEGNLGLTIDRDAAREFMAVSIWLILYSVTTQLYSQANIVMLSVFGDAQAVAEFGVATRYFNMILLLQPSIKTVLRVRMSKAEMTSSTVKQRRFAVKWFKKTALLFAGGIAACCVAARFLFPLLNGSQYDGSILMFQILCINAYSAYLFAPASALIMSLNRYGTQFGISVVALVVNLVGNCLLIPQLGGVGTAIATTASQVLLNVMMTVVVFKAASKNAATLSDNGSGND